LCGSREGGKEAREEQKKNTSKEARKLAEYRYQGNSNDQKGVSNDEDVD
jgi:hypothetical protein